MPIELRISLIVASVLLLIYTFTKLRKTSAHVSDTIFWIICSALVVVIAVFPGIIYFFSTLLHIQSPANLVFALIILMLIIRVFLSSMDIAVLRTRIEMLSQEVALKERELKEERERAPKQSADERPDKDAS